MAKRAIYFDTETTGLDVTKERIIEIAAYDPVENRSFVSFVNPGFSIPPEVIQISHITDDMVKDAPSFAQVGKDFWEFCQGDVVLIAHNGERFDKPLLMNECARHHIPFPPVAFIDTLHWVKKFRPDLPKYSLQYLREVYEIPPNQAHRALDDVMVLHTLFSRMIGNLTIDQVIYLLNRKEQLMTMPFGKYRGLPFSKVPKDYFAWLLGSGALDKPDNQKLKEALMEQNLIAVAAL